MFSVIHLSPVSDFSFSVTSPQCSPHHVQTQPSLRCTVLKKIFNTVSGPTAVAPSSQTFQQNQKLPSFLVQNCFALTRAPISCPETTTQTSDSTWVLSLVARTIPYRGTGPAVIRGKRRTGTGAATARSWPDGGAELELWVELFRGFKQSLKVQPGWTPYSAAAPLRSSQSTVTCLSTLQPTFQIARTFAPVCVLLQTSCCGVPAEISPAALLLLNTAPNAA